jgi:hypothetical protein
MSNYRTIAKQPLLALCFSVIIHMLFSQFAFANTKQAEKMPSQNSVNSTSNDEKIKPETEDNGHGGLDFGSTQNTSANTLTSPPVDTSKFPVLRTNDWRSERDLPWSQPVVMVDEFEGNYLAVFDKNFNDNFWTGEKSGLVSNWSRKYLRIYSYYSQPCDGLFCQRKNIINQASQVSIKMGGKVFKLEGKEGNFNLTEGLAYALKTSPAERTRIKVMFEGNGREVISDIGEGTVKAWKTVYHDASEPR